MTAIEEARDTSEEARDTSSRPELEEHKPSFLYTSLGIWLVRIVTFAVIFGAWEWYGQGQSRALFAPISEIGIAWWELTIQSTEIVNALQDTLIALGIGYALASLVGISVGLLMGINRKIEYVLDPYVSFLYGIPRIALIPLLVIWFGIGPNLRVSIVFLSSVFAIIINTMQGVKEVDQELIDVGIVSCASRQQILRTIIIPGSLPYIFAGLQIGVAQALIGVIVAEMTAIITGLGGLIVEFANFFRTADMFVPILYIAAFSVILNTLMRRLRIWLTPWQEL